MLSLYHAPPLSCHIPLFFFNHTPTTEIYTLSLHDALPISYSRIRSRSLTMNGSPPVNENCRTPSCAASSMKGCTSAKPTRPRRRSPGFEPSRQKGQARLQAVPV